MIILLHGDNIEASYAEFLRRKGTFTALDGSKLDQTSLQQAAHGLFDELSVLYVERLLSKNPKLAAYLTGDVVLWEDKEISAAVIKKIAGVDVKLFKLPVLIFQFLDTFSLATFEKLMETEPPELVFSMFVKRVRQLINIPNDLPAWQVSRLTRQSKSFTMDELISLYEQLGDAEYAIKSGSSPFTFRELLEQVLVTI